MSSQLDPNLEDDDLIQAIAENGAAMAMGESCAMCEAEWVNHGLTHKPDCLFVVVNDLLDGQSLIEEMYGGDAA